MSEESKVRRRESPLVKRSINYLIIWGQTNYLASTSSWGRSPDSKQARMNATQSTVVFQISTHERLFKLKWPLELIFDPKYMENGSDLSLDFTRKRLSAASIPFKL